MARALNNDASCASIGADVGLNCYFNTSFAHLKTSKYTTGTITDAHKAVENSLDDIIDKFRERNALSNRDDEFIVCDDTQVGIEFACEQLSKQAVKPISREEFNRLMVLRSPTDACEFLIKHNHIIDKEDA